ncbi:MAG: HAMP domain-containing histidine kinase [Gammaproteobacteria bacterium]|nr:MAG: HAMP domain-containing histidine kinase [Gammaproteobacteria bacterium]
MKNYTAFMLIIAILVVGMLALIVQTRFQDFKAYHTAIAQESTAGVASEAARFIAEKKRLVDLFAAEHLQLIQELADNPEDEALKRRLQERVSAYFPAHFAFTVTDPAGTPQLEDFDGLIGELCRQDINTSLSTGTQHPRIHPHSEVYHFDILAPFGSGAAAGILLVSFHADILGGALKSAQTPQHQTMLVYPDASQLIEVTADGARINWERDDYRLSADEQHRILSRQAVPGSVWDAVDLHAPDLFTSFMASLLRQSAFILLPFILVSTVMLFYVRREEVRRRKAEKRKDEFVSVVSHELRTPLTSIRGALTLINSEATGKLEPKAKSLTTIALNNALRLETLVNDILDVQKISAGKMEFRKRPVELTPLVERCIVDNRSYGEQHSSSYVLTDAPSGIVVNVDEGRIGQVMSNLLSNAAKYGAERDTIEVAIAVNGRFVRVNVTDHGPGIPEAARHRLFQKFEQVDSSDTRKVGGTGLGLSIVKLITEAHGGKAGFDTETGAGSTFYIELPLSGAVPDGVGFN